MLIHILMMSLRLADLMRDRSLTAGDDSTRSFLLDELKLFHRLVRLVSICVTSFSLLGLLLLLAL